jgi:hypothetical protein
VSQAPIPQPALVVVPSSGAFADQLSSDASTTPAGGHAGSTSTARAPLPAQRERTNWRMRVKPLISAKAEKVRRLESSRERLTCVTHKWNPLCPELEVIILRRCCDHEGSAVLGNAGPVAKLSPDCKHKKQSLYQWRSFWGGCPNKAAHTPESMNLGGRTCHRSHKGSACSSDMLIGQQICPNQLGSTYK